MEGQPHPCSKHGLHTVRPIYPICRKPMHSGVDRSSAHGHSETRQQRSSERESRHAAHSDISQSCNAPPEAARRIDDAHDEVQLHRTCRVRLCIPRKHRNSPIHIVYITYRLYIVI